MVRPAASFTTIPGLTVVATLPAASSAPAPEAAALRPASLPDAAPWPATEPAIFAAPLAAPETAPVAAPVAPPTADVTASVPPTGEVAPAPTLLEPLALQDTPPAAGRTRVQSGTRLSGCA